MIFNQQYLNKLYLTDTTIDLGNRLNQANYNLENICYID